MPRKKTEGEKQKPRRDYGSGSISKRADGRWQGSFYHKGKRHYVYGDVGGTRNQLAQKLKAEIAKAERGELIEPDKITVQQWMEEWLEKRIDYSVNSYVQRELAIRRYIAPSIGSILLQKLTGRDVQQKFVAYMRDRLEASTMHLYMAILNAAMEDAIKAGIILSNPADHVTLPKRERKKKFVLDVDQANQFLTELDYHRWLKPIVMLTLATALRKTELLSLRWSDVDWKKSTLSINHNFAYVSGRHKKNGQRFVEGPPKSQASQRTIVLPAFIIEMLQEHQVKQHEKRSQAGVEWIDRDLIFPGKKGDFMPPYTLDKAFMQARERAGLPDLQFHGLRHSAASILLSMGVPPKVVQEILGHSSISQTMDLYGHVFPAQKVDAARMLNEAFTSLKTDVK
jgi:integrase